MPWRRKKKNGDSQRALEDATAHVQEVTEKNREVYEVAGQLKRIRQHNHFANQLYTIIGHELGRRDGPGPR
jgi:transposase-like protein